MRKRKIMKFGGSSVANREQWQKVAAIVGTQSGVVVVSAMSGMTDQVVSLIRLPRQSIKAKNQWEPLVARIRACIQGLDIGRDESQAILLRADRAWQAYLAGAHVDVLLSIGEILNAMIGACLIPGAEYVDATDCLVITESGVVDEETSYKRIRKRIDQRRVGIHIMGGFHGATLDGSIRTLGRGGSDETAAHVAAALRWPCEIWTDASGILTADPRAVGSGVAKTIFRLTYAEAGELAMRGAKILYRNAVDPVAKAGVPMWIKNTNHPGDRGTLISNEGGANGPVTGIAGLKDPVTIFTIRASHDDLGLGRKVLSVLEDHGLSWDHAATAWRAFTVTVTSEQFHNGLFERVVAALEEVTGAKVEASFEGICLIALVGEGINTDSSIKERLYTALNIAQVPSSMVTQALGCPSHTIGVPKEMYTTALVAIHNAFFGEEA